MIRAGALSGEVGKEGQVAEPVCQVGREEEGFGQYNDILYGTSITSHIGGAI